MSPVLDNPLLLSLAGVLPILFAALVVVTARRRKARLARLGDESLIARLVPVSATWSAGWRATRLGIAAACAGVAIAGPRWGAERTLVRGEGVDVVLAVDASLSMMAPDERPSRLEHVKEEIRRLRAESRGDRFALIAFAGRSYILTPLTVDDGALDLFLDNLDPSVVGQAGSSLAHAIRQGTDLLVSSKSDGDRALVILSDGEAFEPQEDIITAAKAAGAAGVSLVTVGFGTTAGSTIPIREGNSIVEKRDDEGTVVVTRYHPETLQAAANAAAGTFLDAAESDKATKIRRALQRLRGTQRALEGGRAQTPRFQLFLIPALVLLLLDTLLGEQRRRRRVMPNASVATAAVLVLLLPWHSARADGAADAAKEFRDGHFARAAALYRHAIEAGDRRAATLYNYGTALLAADSLPQAIDILDRVTKATDSDVRYRALFNLGLAHLKRGLVGEGDSAKQALTSALDTYKRALLMRSFDGDAKWNYELALRKKKQNSGGGGAGGGNGAPNTSKPKPSAPRDPQSERPSGGIGQQQAEQLLNSAAREERNVQSRKQKLSKPQPPPGGKDW